MKSANDAPYRDPKRVELHGTNDPNPNWNEESMWDAYCRLFVGIDHTVGQPFRKPGILVREHRIVYELSMDGSRNTRPR